MSISGNMITQLFLPMLPGPQGAVILFTFSLNYQENSVISKGERESSWGKKPFDHPDISQTA